MKAGKKAKAITLAVAILVIAGVAAGVYFLRQQPEEPQEPSSSQPESPPAGSEEPEQSASQGQGDVSDTLILLEGGTFTMGSPGSERQRQEDEVSHAPWDMLTFFYEDFGYAPDLTPLGTVESGLEYLTELDSGSAVTVSVCNE